MLFFDSRIYWQVQYVAETNNTVPFDRAPAVVNKALDLIKCRASTTCENDTEFNEILTVAYLEGQKMNVSCLVISFDDRFVNMIKVSHR